MCFVVRRLLLLCLQISGFLAIPVFAQTVSSFTPASGPTGAQGATTLTINGTGFSTTAANNIVFFGAVYKPALTATATQLTIVVPTGATYQNLTVVNTETALLARAFSQNPFIPKYYNEGAMQFSASVNFSYAYGFSLPYFKITDFDGDGKPDIVFLHKEDSTLAILRNTSTSGTVSFDTAAIFYSTYSGNDIYAFEIGDMNGDGKPDILTMTTTGTTTGSLTTLLSIYPNASTTGNISLGTRYDMPKPYADSYTPTTVGRELSLSDIDGDGKLDIVINKGNNEVTLAAINIFRNLSTIGGGLLIDSSRTAFGGQTGTAYAQSVSCADFNGDGKIDIGAVFKKKTSDTTNMVIFYNNSTSGNVNMTSGSSTALITLGVSDDFVNALTDNVNIVNVGDLDGDGKPDLSTSNRGSGNTVSLRNLGIQGSGNFAARSGAALGTVPSWNKLSDFDGDGKPDLAASGKATNTLYIRRNNSSVGAISFSAAATVPLPASPLCFDLCDFDGDGLPDIISINSTTLSIQRSLTKKQTMMRMSIAF